MGGGPQRARPRQPRGGVRAPRVTRCAQGHRVGALRRRTPNSPGRGFDLGIPGETIMSRTSGLPSFSFRAGAVLVAAGALLTGHALRAQAAPFGVEGTFYAGEYHENSGPVHVADLDRDGLADAICAPALLHQTLGD